MNKRVIAFLLTLTLMLSLLWVPGLDQTVVHAVSSDITTDTTWSGEITVENEIKIQNGATLSISNSSTVKFAANAKIIVEYGNITAGQARFTSSSGAADWKGILVTPMTSAAMSLVFNGCTFEYVNNPSGDGGIIRVNETSTDVVTSPYFNVSLSIADSQFINNNTSTHGIFYANGYNKPGLGSLTVTSTTFSGLSNGVYVGPNNQDDIDIIVSGCSFTNNSSNSVWITDGRNVTVMNNTFSGNSVVHSPVVPYYSYQTSNYAKNIVITGNTFYGTGSTAAYPITVHAASKLNQNINGTNTLVNYPSAYQFVKVESEVGSTTFNSSAVWGVMGIPYLINSTVQVYKQSYASYSDLTIKPGVTVKFTGEGQILFNGSLTADGTIENPIALQKLSGSALTNKVHIYGSNIGGSVKFDYVFVDGLYQVMIESGNSTDQNPVQITNSTFQKSGDIALKLYNYPSTTNHVLVEGCTFNGSQSTGTGLQLELIKYATVKNTLIYGYTTGLTVHRNEYSDGAILIENCTIANNKLTGINVSRESSTAYGPTVKNSILSGNLMNIVAQKSSSGYYATISNASISYSCVTDDNSLFSSNIYTTTAGVFKDYSSSAFSNCFTSDPAFVDASNSNFRLKSTAGHYTGSAWINDETNSPCIDAGDPFSAYDNEPTPKGTRINLGYDGNTAYASKSAGASDTTPPNWSAGYPTIGAVQLDGSRQVELIANADESGIAYYVVVADGATAPSAVQVMNGLDGSGSSALASGNTNISANTVASMITSALPADHISYDAYLIAKDLAGNTTTAATKLDITTPVADTAAPVWSSDYPKAGTAQSSGSKMVEVLAKSNEAGTVYYVVVASGAAIPSTSQVLAGKDSTGSNALAFGSTSVSANTEKSIVTGALPADVTSYDVYLVQKDASNNSTSAIKVSMTTPQPESSSGSTGGSGGTSLIPTSTVPTTNEGSVQISVTASVDSSGNAAAAVNQTTADQMITSAITAEKSGKQAEIRFDLNTSSTPGTAPGTALSQVSLAIPTGSFSKIASETSAQVTVGNGLATLTFDKTAVDAIAGAVPAGTGSIGNVTISVERVNAATLSQKAQEVIGNHPVYNFSVTAGNKSVEKFNLGSVSGSVSVSIPYTLQSGENQHAIVIYYIDSQGTVKTVRGVYDAAAKTVNFTTSHFSKFAIGHNLITFKDVPPGYWFSDPVAFIAARGITTGSGDGYYSLNSRLTRAQFIVMMMRAYGIEPTAPSPGTGSSSSASGQIDNFPDAGNFYYTAYLAEAKRLGISKGDEKGMFGPDRQISRQDMFTLLYRTLDVLKELPTASTTKSLADFTDQAKVSSYAKAPMTTLVKGGIVSGSNGMLNPLGTSTRAEMAQVLYNLLGN